MKRFTNSGLIIGFLFLISPLGLYWFIHGSYERYVWIINQPFPLSHFGGGPAQLLMYSGLILFGLILITFSFILKRKNNK